MITKITVNTDTHSDLPWPAELSLPAAGDAVTLQFGADAVSFVVVSRSFSVVTRSSAEEPSSTITIEGKTPTIMP